MFEEAKAFSRFSVDDVPKAKDFYSETLGLDVSEENGMLTLHITGGNGTLIFPKGDHHVPATFTVLNFPVDNIETTVDELTARGVTLERYEDSRQGSMGIFREMGPYIAWFKDPAGNVLSVLQAN